MSYVYLLYLFLLECFHCLQHDTGWEYINVQCRDNDNEPVDWWYIYKTPSDAGPNLESGSKFFYLTPDTVGRWKPSSKDIFANSMLRYTITPLFDDKYANDLGKVSYEERKPMGSLMGSASRGLMLANSLGGLWMGHTVPRFPDFTTGVPIFPPEELENGHMFICMTLDLPTLNALAAAVKQTEPYIGYILIPHHIYLPDWKMLLSPYPTISKSSVRKTKILHFVTKAKSLRGLMFARSPGDARCLYKSFAKVKQIVMDVYGHREHNNVYCGHRYSIRHIESISLKVPDNIYYIKNSSDSMGFAISTGASWQRNGLSSYQYWTCTGHIENQPVTSLGGMIICVTNFHVWLAFDQLKVKEPECKIIEDD